MPYGKKYMIDNQYRLDVLAKQRAYYIKNKEKILGKLREKVKCDICNTEFVRGNLSVHQRSNKHKRNCEVVAAILYKV
jgi:hypothetical protein